MSGFASFGRAMHGFGIACDSAALERLAIFERAFFAWNATHNISAVRDSHTFERYCVDCAYPLCFVRPFASLLDVGSGGGFPALVLGALVPSARLCLVEPNKKKAAFLLVAAQQMGLSCTILRDRIENVQAQSAELLCSRALCAPEIFLPLVAHICTRAILLYTGSQRLENAAAMGFAHARYAKIHYLYKEL
ncbi:MAG: class I SAM-dependent methyltransferase [Helicobacter sp.]|nr:class I SAM-dependent methyltransferase [Helicobacter sp.]